MKREGLTIDSTSKKTGQIVTGIEVSGKYDQTDMQTSVRVALSEQKRYKALQTEPSGTPKVSAGKLSESSERIKAAIKA